MNTTQQLEPAENVAPPPPGPGELIERVIAARGFAGVMLLGPRAWRRWWHALVRSIDHAAILAQVDEDASFSFNFNFMIVVAGGIATIGLLLNSPAVIIGAMLISPLMGPIVATGMALATLDVDLGRKSAKTLLLGTAAAIAFTSLIVFLSPVKDLTPELLARTRPNLFDLVVAILSGTAGGYAMIRGRGGAIVGVAIATALMPPLGTIGYGLVTQQWDITRGALLLFVTNMVAISLAVAAVAEWYGFGRGELRKRFARQAVISLLVLAPLAVPLFYSLKAIAFESFAQVRIRSVLERGANSLPEGQLGEVSVLFIDGKPPRVRAVMYSAAPEHELPARLNAAMEAEVGQAIDLRVTQLRTSDELPPQLRVREVAPVPAPAPVPETTLADSLRDAFPLPLAAFEADIERRTAILVPAPQPGIDIASWRDMEHDLSARHTDWTLSILPPMQTLPTVRFGRASAAIEAGEQDRIDAIVWALKRWNIERVQVIGHASSDGGGSLRLANARANRVAEAIRAQGLGAETRGRYPLPSQLAGERELGQIAFRAVSIVIPTPDNTGSGVR
ncbi:MAG: TIGR00341 family protein [Betaproteobacteria bacterium HGW-Betaproteobacteria-13]|jgi:uncharacterized hydrophobic protein (TIGR00271 family)|nr:MAG: TIGR00341 family protein [Betaproteobacteria bacterium HGW-Betaproteobacteria-13]